MVAFVHAPSNFGERAENRGTISWEGEIILSSGENWPINFSFVGVTEDVVNSSHPIGPEGVCRYNFIMHK